MKKYLVASLSVVSAIVLAQAPAVPTVPASSSATFAQPQDCKVDSIDQAKMKEINYSYAAKFKKVGDDTQNKSKKIQDEGPHTGDVDGAIGVTGHFEPRRLDYSLDLPEVTVKDQEMSYDLPEITMKPNSFSYDTIRTTTGSDCRAGPDETVWEWHTCDEGKLWAHPCLDARTRPGSPICLPTIKMEKAREEIILDIPETKMVRHVIVVGVPEFTMKTQKYSFDYPVFIVDSVQVKADEQKQAGEDLKRTSTAAIQSLTAAMKSELRSITAKPLDQAYSCQKAVMQFVARQQYDMLIVAATASEAGLKIATEKNIPAAIAAYKASLVEQTAARQKLLAKTVADRRAAAKNHRNELAKL